MEKRTKTDFIIVHHSATDRDTTAFESIKKYHMEHNGWDNIGYHRVIEGDGRVSSGMPINMVGYHCLYGGFNYKSVAVCLTGNFQNEHPSEAQLESLEKILDEWKTKYGISNTNILGHRETGAATSCPGDNLVSWLEKYRVGETVGECLSLDEDVSTEIEDKYNLKNLSWYSKYWTGHEFIQGTLEYIKKVVSERKELKKELSGLAESGEEYESRIRGLLKEEKVTELKLVGLVDDVNDLTKKIDKAAEDYSELGKKYTKEVKFLTDQRDEVQKDFTKFKETVSKQNKIYKQAIIDLTKRVLDLQKPEEVNTMNNKMLFEAMKKPLRLLVLATLPFAIAYFAELPYGWAGMVTIILTGLDSFLHTLGKVTNNEKLVTGLTRF